MPQRLTGGVVRRRGAATDRRQRDAGYREAHRDNIHTQGIAAGRSAVKRQEREPAAGEASTEH